MITEYPQEFKESMLQKIFFNPDRSVVSFAREANIPGSTVATWVRNYKKKNGKIMGQKKHKKLWSAEKRFETVLLTAPMNEAEKSEYCRKHGIYPAQLKEWKKDCIAGCRNAPDKKYIALMTQFKKPMHSLIQSIPVKSPLMKLRKKPLVSLCYQSAKT